MLKIDTRFVHAEIQQEAEKHRSQAVTAFSELMEKKCVGSEWTGFWDYPQKAGYDQLQKIIDYVDSINLPYDNILVLGIGGSFQGTLAVRDALVRRDDNLSAPTLTFCGYHLSEMLTIDCLDQLEESDPLLVVISKSGSTLETASAFRLFRHYLEKRYGTAEAHQRIIAITDPEKGSLRAFSQKSGCHAFPIPPDIGGRYSVLTAVGLVPLTLAAYPTPDLLRGADALFCTPISNDHPAVRYATIRYAAYQQGKHIEVLSYCDPQLQALADWWKQLFGESEGKKQKGLFPTTLALTTDLHSLGQYLQDGERTLLESYLTVEDLQYTDARGVKFNLPLPADELDQMPYLEGKTLEQLNTLAINSTRLAHYDGGVPNLNIVLPRLDAYSLGYFFAFSQVACALSASLLDVHPFDQEGVENYKRNLLALAGKAGLEQEAKKLQDRLQ